MNTHLINDELNNFKTENLYIIQMAGKIRDIIFCFIVLLLLVFCGQLKCCSVEEKRNGDSTGIQNSSSDISSSKQVCKLN